MWCIQGARERLEDELRVTRQNLSNSKADLARLKQEMSQRTHQLAEARGTIASKDDEIAELQRRLAERVAEQSELEKHVAADLHALTAETQDTSKHRDALLSQLAVLQSENAALRAESEGQMERAEEALSMVRQRDREVSHLQTALEDTERRMRGMLCGLYEYI